jgi:hypothetical protein
MLVVAVALAVPVLAQEAPQQKPGEAAADPISGSWEGTTLMGSQEMAFFMTLRLDKESISGEIGNYEGSTGLTGTWVDGKLTLNFSYVNGEPVIMTAAVKDGQLAGNLDMNGGQVQTTWTAKKKV